MGHLGSIVAMVPGGGAEAEKPYWTENGSVTVEDPDHWRVVLMPQPPGGW